MYRKEAIKKFCVECAGSSKDALLCPIFNCPLWEWRTGNHVNSNKYQQRIKRAFRYYKNDFDELKGSGIDIERYLGK